MKTWAQTNIVSKIYLWTFFNVSKASTQAEFCNVTRLLDASGSYQQKVNILWISNTKIDDNKCFNPKRNETNQREYYKHCIKSKHPNVFICPNEGKFYATDDVHKNLTIYLRLVIVSSWYQGSITNNVLKQYRANY